VDFRGDRARYRRAVRWAAQLPSGFRANEFDRLLLIVFISHEWRHSLSAGAGSVVACANGLASSAGAVAGGDPQIAEGLKALSTQTDFVTGS
jgi:hypothetical protein